MFLGHSYSLIDYEFDEFDYYVQLVIHNRIQVLETIQEKTDETPYSIVEDFAGTQNFISPETYRDVGQ